MPIPVGSSAQPVSPGDLGTYLNNPAVAADPRAAVIIGYATTLCESVVSPLPAGAEVVILDVAERAYANPTSTNEDRSLGLYSEGVGAFSQNEPGLTGGGLFLTQENKATLLRLVGRGGAFTIDTTPATAGTGLPPWDINNWSYW